MNDFVVLDAVAVASLAQEARDRCTGASADHATALLGFAAQLDEVAETALQLDQHEHEIEHQLRWWEDRVRELETRVTGQPGDDVETGRELALYRGRISGAHTMRRHYSEQRNALAVRHAQCAAEIAAH